MVEIAQTFTDSERYLRAARDFRLPFWDYYLPRGYETIFPGFTIGQVKKTGEFINYEDVIIADRTTQKRINAADMKIKTVKEDEDEKKQLDVELLVSTEHPYDFGIPQIFMLEKVMLHLPPNGKVKLDHNPLRTFWFPNNNEIPESQWNYMGMKVSQGNISTPLRSAYGNLETSEKTFLEAIQCVICCSDTKVPFRALTSE